MAFTAGLQRVKPVQRRALYTCSYSRSSFLSLQARAILKRCRAAGMLKRRSEKVRHLRKRARRIGLGD